VSPVKYELDFYNPEYRHFSILVFDYIFHTDIHAVVFSFSL
jgi:hypothetical protein